MNKKSKREVRSSPHREATNGWTQLIVQTLIAREADPELFALLNVCSPRRRATALRSLALKHLLSGGDTAVPVTQRTSTEPSQVAHPSAPAPQSAAQQPSSVIGAALQELFSVAGEVTITFKPHK